MAGIQPAIQLKEEKDMRVRLLLAAVCIFTLPIFLSPSEGDKHINSAPFASVAMAGHVILSGSYCPCDGSCESGPGPQGLQRTSDQPSTDTATSDNEVANGVDLGAGVMLLTLTLLYGLRLRF